MSLDHAIAAHARLPASRSSVSAASVFPMKDLREAPMTTGTPSETNRSSCRMMARLWPAVFPTLDQQDRAKQAITKQWDGIVGANVK